MPPVRRVVLICGPPGSGKTTWAKASGLRVYDRDDPQWTSERQFRAAIARLATDPHARAVVIRAGASSSARARAAGLIGATETIVLAVPADEAKRRVAGRGTRATISMRTQMASVDTWWQRYEPGTVDPVRPTGKTHPIGDPALKTPARRRLRRAILVQVQGGRGCEIPTCLMSHRVIDWRAAPGTPWAYVLDEITPRYIGGRADDPQNVRPAHHRCNAAGGARITQAIKRGKRARQGEQAATAGRW